MIYKDYKEIIKLIQEISLLHNELSCEIIQETDRNLKKKTVCDVMSDTVEKVEFLRRLNEYCNDVNRSIEIRELVSKFCIRYRVKTSSSITEKLKYYFSSICHHNGKVPINKCLNDLALEL